MVWVDILVFFLTQWRHQSVGLACAAVPQLVLIPLLWRLAAPSRIYKQRRLKMHYKKMQNQKTRTGKRRTKVIVKTTLTCALQLQFAWVWTRLTRVILTFDKTDCYSNDYAKYCHNRKSIKCIVHRRSWRTGSSASQYQETCRHSLRKRGLQWNVRRIYVDAEVSDHGRQC